MNAAAYFLSAPRAHGWLAGPSVVTDGPELDGWLLCHHRPVRELPADQLLDGEAITPCPRGFPDFHAMHTADGAKRACLLAFDQGADAHMEARPTRSMETSLHWRAQRLGAL
jgi:hypothetical protein